MTNSLKATVTFFLILLVVCIFYFVLIHEMSQKPYEIVTEDDFYILKYTDLDIPLNPSYNFWKEFKSVKIHLFPQSARIPYGNEERDVWIRGAYNDIEIAFLMEFEDQTKNNQDLLNPDACAILFVPKESVATAQMMGHGSNANIWHWLAHRDTVQIGKGKDSIPAVRELITVGPGTQNPMANQFVEGKGKYKNQKWSVIMKRRLKAQQDGELDFNTDSGLKIAFAVWDGAKQESFGIKSISILKTLSLVKD